MMTDQSIADAEAAARLVLDSGERSLDRACRCHLCASARYSLLLVIEVRRLRALPIAQKELRAATAWRHIVHGEPYQDRAAYAEAVERAMAAWYALTALEGT